MADYKTLIKDKKTQNWLKASIAFNITKDGLSDFVNNIAGHLQQTILTDVRKNNRLLVTATCNVCRTGNAVHCQSTKKCPSSCNLHKDTSITYNLCPNHICHNFATELKKYHRYNQSSFKNTDSTKWCSSAWEIAKCYHPPDGYLDKPDASVTDFNGVVSVIINCKEFDNHVTENLSDKKNIFVQSRDVVKSIRHTATLQVEDADLKDTFTAMRVILSDTKTLSGNTQAQEAINKLSSLEADTLTITIEDVVKLIQDSLDDTRGIINEAKHTNEETKELQSKLNSKEEELKNLLKAITKARDEAIKDVEKASEVATNAATDKLKIASEDVTKAATDKIKIAGEDVTNAATDKIKIAGEDVTKDTKDKIKIAGEDVTKAAKDQIKIAGENVTNAATDKITVAGEDVTKATTDKIKIAGEDVTNAATDKITIVGEDVTKAATDKIKIAGEDVTKAATDKIKTAGEDVTKDAKDKIKIAGEDVTKAATDKMKIASEDVTNAATDKIKIAGEDVTKAAKDKINIACEDVTKTATDKIKTASQREESRVLETGQTIKQDMERTSEHASKAATEKLKIAGEMGESRVKEAGQRVKLALEEEKKKVVADARVEMTKEACGILTDIKSEVEKTQQNKPADEIYEERKHELQQALAHHYWNKHDSMPLSPLMPDIDDKLTKFYIGLKMNKMDTKLPTKPVQELDSVNTYKALFYNDSNIPHRNIYIQGEAGKGKTTFCTKLGLVWSETNLSKKDSSLNKSTVQQKQSQVFSDESILSKFDFVFSLALRNVTSECEIERMIETQIISGLPDHTKYAGLVPKILDKERCLIILDGLDEWSHRSDCDKSERIPHRKSWSNTAVLTLTRPWKMNELRLRDSEISTLIQITGITESQTFTKNVLNCLNEKFSTTCKVTDFLGDIRVKKLEHFLDIPVVAMQLLCLWHRGHDLGNSKCKIYLNMLDMMFGRTQEKSPSACDDIDVSLKTGLPPCLESSMFCKQHKMLLDSLGNLAFHTLYSNKREESLVFSDFIAISHMKSTAALKTALTTGILSQHKSPSLLEKRSHFSFLHKTFQEFLAAYHIATHADESENIVQTLFQVYGQTVDIMDISELFIFVCGLNTEMSCKISNSVMKSFSVKLTNHIEELLVSGGHYNVAGMTKSLQKMILAGYKESISNGHQDPQLALHHVYYDRYISGDDTIYGDRDRLVYRNIDKIVTLCAETCTVDEVKIQQILAQSSSTLSNVSLQYVEGLTDASLDLFTNITLKSLYLQWIDTHFDIKLSTSSLLYCYLVEINKEVEHSVLSALTTAPKLHTLVVRYCKNMSVLSQVLPTLPMLHRLDVWETKISASVCQAMSTLSQLQSLTVSGLDGCEDLSLLCQLPSTLTNLQYIALGYTDLGDNDILLPNSIQEIVLWKAILTCRSVRQLVDRLTQIPHKVTCTLGTCTVRPEKKWRLDWEGNQPKLVECTLNCCTVRPEEWDAIVKHIHQSHMFEIHRNEFYNLQFTKIQT